MFKKISWLASRKYPDYIGGAEITDYVLKEEGKKLGIEIEDEVQHYSSDILIVSNIHDFKWKDIKPILKNKRIVMFPHDVFWKEYHPYIYQKAKVSVLMSPLQYNYLKQKFLIKNYFYQPCAILDIDQYYPAKKEEVAVYIGDIHGAKGVFNIINYARQHPKLIFRLYGRNMINIMFTDPNIEYLGWLDPSNIPETLAKAKFYIHLPQLIDTCPRIVLFAYLCGCTIIGNNNIGLFSYKWNWKDKEEIRNIIKEYPKKFWYTLDKKLKEE